MITERVLVALNVMTVLITLLLWFGWIQSEPLFFLNISFAVKCIVGLVLMYRFNDIWPSKTFTVIDRKICFLAGTYIFAFTIGDFLKRNIIPNIQMGI
jgi:hypothetical protein